VFQICRQTTLTDLSGDCELAAVARRIQDEPTTQSQKQVNRTDIHRKAKAIRISAHGSTISASKGVSTEGEEDLVNGKIPPITHSL
jgi:hypothetical protein